MAHTRVSPTARDKHLGGEDLDDPFDPVEQKKGRGDMSLRISISVFEGWPYRQHQLEGENRMDFSCIAYNKWRKGHSKAWNRIIGLNLPGQERQEEISIDTVIGIA